MWWGRLKCGSAPGMKNREALACFYINLHNELKSYLPRKISKLINLCILKREGRQKRELSTSMQCLVFDSMVFNQATMKNNYKNLPPVLLLYSVIPGVALNKENLYIALFWRGKINGKHNIKTIRQTYECSIRLVTQRTPMF